MFKLADFAKRRKMLMQQIGPKGIVILAAAPIANRNGDYQYPYRQQSNFYYLTGFEEPEAVAIFMPKRKQGEFVLFNRPKDRAIEIWEGLRLGQKGACDTIGADQAFPIESLEEKLPELLSGREELHYSLGVDAQFDQVILRAINKIRGKIRNGVQSPIAFVDINPTIHEMRLIKSPSELAAMRKAASISANAHIRAMQICKPGMNEYQLDAELNYEFQRHGARHVAYSSIVGSGPNTCILHYITNNRTINDGELVLIDAGCEWSNYASDVTRTFPANGRFSKEQRAVYEIVLAAQLAAIKAIKPGVSFDTIQAITVNIITQGLIDLEILKGERQELIEQQAYLPFYMHKVSHWLGLDVHDVGRYKLGEKWRKLQAGMLLTVEPGIYISADIPGVHKRWHNIGVRIEDDILVTSRGHEVLSHAAPKTIADIEKLMAKK
jgi:Xaa-Pro aminopeptidase